MKQFFIFLFGLLSMFFGSFVHAAPVDLSSLTNAIDFSTTSTAILAAGAALIGVYIVWKAAGLVIRAVRGL